MSSSDKFGGTCSRVSRKRVGALPVSGKVSLRELNEEAMLTPEGSESNPRERQEQRTNGQYIVAVFIEKPQGQYDCRMCEKE